MFGRIVWLNLVLLVGFCSAACAAERPNFVWIVIEDMSPNFACYGESAISTPNLDEMAAKGLRFTRASTTGPVCSASRSALITGMYQTSIGAHHHRSGRGSEKILLPTDVRLIPEIMQRYGYFTGNAEMSGLNSAAGGKPGKTDYNFEWNPAIYEGVDWSERKPSQPFFVQIQLPGGKLRHRRDWPQLAKEALGSVTDPERVTLPPYLPRDPVILKDWAEYLDTVRYTDLQVGGIAQRLEEEGLLESTYIFVLSDHGISHVRAKQFCYEAGLSIPLIVTGPGIVGSVREDLVQHIDVSATTLGLAGISIPSNIQGQDLLAADFKPRQYTFAARDRCDETVDRIRSIRNERYKYIQNFYPERPYLQPNVYKDHKPIVQAMRRLHSEGKLDDAQSLIMADRRPREELYDLEADPFELNNLVSDQKKHEVALIELRGTLATWIANSNDLGQDPESPYMYASDMRVYLNEIQPGDPKRAAEIQANIELMRRWDKEGK